jgi:hypothetical protein
LILIIFLLFFSFFPLLLCLMGIHCGICKGSYNISKIIF